MDAALYVSMVQDRMFIALGGLLGAFVFDSLRGALFRHTSDPRPCLERIYDAILTPLVLKMNRNQRADGTLVMRGALIMAVLTAASFAGITYAYIHARQYVEGGIFMCVFVALSTSTLSWFWPLRALSAAITNPKAPRPFLSIARACYANLVTLDDGGLIRVAVTGAVKSLVIRLIAPIVLFVLFGWQALAIYWPIMTMSLIAGQDGTNQYFALVPNVLAGLFLIVPIFLGFPIVLAALFFSAGASFFRALPGAFKIHRWPTLVQGGAVTMVVAYSMKLLLGGPRQDREGNAVPAPWIGPNKGTARLEPRDIGRVLYLSAVTLLLLAAALYVLEVLLTKAAPVIMHA